ncbi:MAG: metal-dependent hydrolase [Planctomycetota bacterium]
MPSPIAHSSLLLMAWPSMRERLGALSPMRRGLFLIWLTFALLAPDLDLLIGVVTGQGLRPLHGGPTHSLLLAPLFGLLWMWPGRAIGGGAWRYRTLFICATLAYASHVLLDVFTPGRGVALLWPLPLGDQAWFSLKPQRFGSPIPLFVGVEHSNWRDLGHHALTLVTELAFAAVMFGVGLALARSRPHTTAPTKQP